MTGICNVLCLAVIVAIFRNTIAVNYCNLSCRIRGTTYMHTMCKYPHSGPGPLCRDWYQRGFSESEKQAILKQHNDARRKVASGQETRGKNGPQPPAVRMPDLEWNDELAMIAQRWVDQCDYGHDSCRRAEKFSSGQNAARISTVNENNIPFSKMIKTWYDEVADFNPDQIPSFTGDVEKGVKLTHYTQIVWATTTKIGCGRIKYRRSPDNRMSHYIICNYGPAGNTLGRPIYEVRK